MARLVGESGPVAGKEWKIEHGLTLGREAHNSVAMPDNRKASRDHAKVWREAEGRYSVADLGSTNGTLVNDDRVTRQVLVDGDEIRVGEATFRFVLDEEEKPRKAPTGPARAAELFGVPRAGPEVGLGGAPAGAGMGAAAGPGAAEGPKIEVKQRVLQYRKKVAGGSVTSWDLSQASDGMRWGLMLLALAVAAGLFFAIKALVFGG